MKKIANFIIALFISLNVMSVNLLANFENTTPEVHLNNSTESNGIELIYGDYGVGVYKYLITNVNETYTLLIDTVNNIYMIENHLLSSDEFFKLVEYQSNNPNSKVTEFVKSYSIDNVLANKYSLMHEKYELNLKNHMHPLTSRCMFCPLATRDVPTTNYESTERYLGNKSNRMEIALTQLSISAFASYVTWGNDSWATKLIKKFLKKFNEEKKWAYIEFDQYQSFHNICPIAVREKRFITVSDDESQYKVEETYTHYFYSSKPY